MRGAKRAALAAISASLLAMACGGPQQVAGGGASSEAENALGRVLVVHVAPSLVRDTLVLRSNGPTGSLVRRLWGDSLHVLAFAVAESAFVLERSSDSSRVRLPSLREGGDSLVSLWTAVDSQGGLAAEVRTARNCPTGSLCGLALDLRDGRTYSWVQLGKVRWMRQNMAYVATGSYRGGGAYAPFDSLGQVLNGVYYPWRQALDSACPIGWRLAGSREWNDLETLTEHRADRIRAVGRWSGRYAGTDRLGLGFLPSGQRGADGSWSQVGAAGGAFLWTSQVSDSAQAWNRNFFASDTLFGDEAVSRSLSLPVRCVSP